MSVTSVTSVYACTKAPPPPLSPLTPSPFPGPFPQFAPQTLNCLPQKVAAATAVLGQQRGLGPVILLSVCQCPCVALHAPGGKNSAEYLLSEQSLWPCWALTPLE